MRSEVPGLAGWVSSLTAYDMAGEPGVHIGMPSTSVTVILSADDPLDVAWIDDPASRRRLWANASGLHLRPARIRHGLRQRGVEIGLTPAGTRALLGVPAAELVGGLYDLGDIHAGLGRLPQRLAESDPSCWEGLVAEALAAAPDRHQSSRPRWEVTRALGLLGAGSRVAAAAAAVGLSRRHLSQLVVAETGVTPQQWLRLCRFQRSKPMVARGTRLATVAAESGYADQAHLTRDWVSLAGCSPTSWRRAELPIVQDMAARRDQTQAAWETTRAAPPASRTGRT